MNGNGAESCDRGQLLTCFIPPFVLQFVKATFFWQTTLINVSTTRAKSYTRTDWNGGPVVSDSGCVSIHQCTAQAVSWSFLGLPHCPYHSSALKHCWVKLHAMQNWSKVRVKASTLQNISISNKLCSLELFIHQQILKKCTIFSTKNVECFQH